MNVSAQVNYLPELPVFPINHLKSKVAKDATGLISADFSLYRDLHEEILISNCRANRLIDYAHTDGGICR